MRKAWGCTWNTSERKRAGYKQLMSWLPLQLGRAWKKSIRHPAVRKINQFSLGAPACLQPMSLQARQGECARIPTSFQEDQPPQDKLATPPERVWGFVWSVTSSPQDSWLSNPSMFVRSSFRSFRSVIHFNFCSPYHKGSPYLKKPEHLWPRQWVLNGSRENLYTLKNPKIRGI